MAFEAFSARPAKKRRRRNASGSGSAIARSIIMTERCGICPASSVRVSDASRPAIRTCSTYAGWTTSTNVEDWTVVMEVCDRANLNEVNAKDASKALRKDIQ